MIRLLPVLLAVLLASCVARAPQPAPGTGVVLPPPPSQPPSGPGDDEMQPGNPIPPLTVPGQPTPLPDVRPPLSPNLPRGVESSGAPAPVVSLVKGARAAHRQGRTAEAEAQLERALRIEPRNPWVWQALATVHLAAKDAEQAESEAKKSNSLGKRNPYLEVENWRLIAEARRMLGDKAGAADAQGRHEDLKLLLTP